MDQVHLNRIKEARLKYKPDEIKCLFIAEAPPSSPDRFFYFEDVREKDSLYLELIGILFKDEFPENKFVEKYGEMFASGPPTNILRKNKKEYLTKFKEKGYYLIDSTDYPLPSSLNRTKDKIKFLEGSKEKLYQKVKGLVDTIVPIVLISVPVFQANSGNLKYYGYNIINDESIEFPGSGQQKNFRKKMEVLIEKKLK